MSQAIDFFVANKNWVTMKPLCNIRGQQNTKKSLKDLKLG